MFNTLQFQRQRFELSCSWQNDCVICVAQFLLFSLFLCNCVWHFFPEGTMMLNMWKLFPFIESEDSLVIFLQAYCKPIGFQACPAYPSCHMARGRLPISCWANIERQAVIHTHIHTYVHSILQNSTRQMPIILLYPITYKPDIFYFFFASTWG